MTTSEIEIKLMNGMRLSEKLNKTKCQPINRMFYVIANSYMKCVCVCGYSFFLSNGNSHKQRV
jgi:hypothetical protein